MYHRNQRTIINYPADIYSNGRTFGGIIANLSREGVGLYILNPLDEDTADCSPGNGLFLEFQLSSGEFIRLNCLVKWLHKTKSMSNTMTSIGTYIVSPPFNYLNFLDSLNETLQFVSKEIAFAKN